MLHILSHPSATELRSNCLLVIKFITYSPLSHYWSQDLIQFSSLPSTVLMARLPEGYHKDDEDKYVNHMMASAMWQSSSHSRCASQACVLCSFNHSQPQALSLHLMQGEMPSSQTQGFISSWQLVSPEVRMTYFHSVSCAGTSEGSLGFSC